jgi:hypothetical protein
MSLRNGATNEQFGHIIISCGTVQENKHMGYSCTKAADDTLKLIGKTYALDGNPNILKIGAGAFFFECGREQTDGAITGKLMEMLPNDMCKSIGSVRIAPDGSITRFPAIPRNVKTRLAIMAHKRS